MSWYTEYHNNFDDGFECGYKKGIAHGLIISGLIATIGIYAYTQINHKIETKQIEIRQPIDQSSLEKIVEE